MPANTPTPHDSPHRDAAIQILRTLREHGHTAYLAGGCVRDELLNLAPTDYDVATDAHPDRVQELFPHTAAVGAAFGVVLVHQRVGDDPNTAIPTPTTTEVATFRTDGPYTDSRRPDHVTFSTPEHDAQRRDFTINALFLDPLKPDPAEQVIDFVGGRSDLDAKLIRAVGNPDARFDEDDLRALRAVRFAARYGFTIHPETAAAITRHAAQLEGVSRERIGHELRKMLAHPTRAHAIAQLHTLSLAGPVLQASSNDPAPTLATLEALAPTASHIAALFAWTIDRAGTWPCPIHASTLRQALMLSNDETAALANCDDALRGFTLHWHDLPIATRKRLATHAGAPDAQAVLAAHDPSQAARVTADIQALANDAVGLAPTPLIAGDALIAHGYRPGPGFAPLLAALYDHQLEANVHTREQALALADDLAASHHVHKI